MAIFLRLALGCLMAAALTGCASASKDIHFRSRLPTQEIPLLTFDKTQQWGVDIDAENNRFTFQPTHNLVDNYDLDQNTHYFSSDEYRVNGADALGTYRRTLGTVPTKIGFSLDALELQINPLADAGGEWFTNLNFGLYKTAAFTSTGTDCFACLTSEDGRNADLKEKDISTSQSGNELKMGVQVGKLFQEKYAWAISFNWMDYSYTADVTRTGSPDLHLKEHFFAAGAGVGFFFIPRQIFNFGLTIDGIEMHWRGNVEAATVVGLRTKLAF